MFNTDINSNNYYGLALNIKDQNRQERFFNQRKLNGFDETEWYNLKISILKFTLPRLKDFKNNCKSYPANMNSDEWSNILGRMILEIEDYINDKHNNLTLFFKYFDDLWS